MRGEQISNLPAHETLLKPRPRSSPLSSFNGAMLELHLSTPDLEPEILIAPLVGFFRREMSQKDFSRCRRGGRR